MSNRVTNLNIFSTALTIGEMQEHTMGGNCAVEGDYLAWGEMQWKLKGEASIENVDEKEPCIGQPSFNLYPAKYSSMQSCKHHCQKLGSRSPSLVTLEQWANLQMVLEGLINNNGAKDIWLALNDTDSTLPQNGVNPKSLPLLVFQHFWSFVTKTRNPK